MEVFLPKLKNYYSLKKESKAAKTKRWEKDSRLNQTQKSSQFDDMLEMVVQYGFVTMFSPAFPLAAFFALINNLFEIRIDAQKYLKDLPRVMPQPIYDSGPWLDILEITTKVSVLLNACIIAFTSVTLDELYYFFQVAPNRPGYTYRDFSFTHYNISNYPRELQDVAADVNFHTDTCLVLGDFEEVAGNLQLTRRHWKLALVRFAFVVIFENGIFLLQSLVGRIVRHQASDVAKTRQRREVYLANQLMAKEKISSCQRTDAERKLCDDDNRYQSSGRRFSLPSKPTIYGNAACVETQPHKNYIFVQNTPKKISTDAQSAFGESACSDSYNIFDLKSHNDDAESERRSPIVVGLSRKNAIRKKSTLAKRKNFPGWFAKRKSKIH